VATRSWPKRDHSLITVAALIARRQHRAAAEPSRLAKTNGLTEVELKEVIIHLAFYAGWRRAMSAIQVAKAAFADRPAAPPLRTDTVGPADPTATRRT
jgi:alkylhydroperoxidase/carboxymuconolactone decarboxylase family protein YurZ